LYEKPHRLASKKKQPALLLQPAVFSGLPQPTTHRFTFKQDQTG
jgi:hypothetical protein